MATPRTPRDHASAAVRDRIMDVAEELMAGRGYAATSISAVCKESGLPVGSIYHHFGSKAGLLHAVAERGSRRFFADLPDADSFPGSPQERLAAHYRAAARTVLAHLSFFRIDVALLLQPTDDPEVRAIMTEVREGAVRQVSAILASIAADAGAPDAPTLARHLATMTVVFTRGAVCEAAADPAAFGSAFDGLRAMVWGRIEEQVRRDAADGRPVTRDAGSPQAATRSSSG
ncbi:MAG: TetR/AcrR family transcriptional regulator [Pseudonocardia sp.]